MKGGQYSQSDSGACSDMEQTTPPPHPKILLPSKKLRRNYRQINGFLAHLDDDTVSCDSLNLSDDSNGSMEMYANIVRPIHESLLRSSKSPPNIPPPPIPFEYDYDNESNETTIHMPDTQKINFLPEDLLKNIRDRAAQLISCTISETEDDDNENDRFDESNDREIGEELATRFTVKLNYDKFYRFHINERCLSSGLDSPSAQSYYRNNESFAGYKSTPSGTSTIRSAKGTVRGVRNRVRNGITTFLQLQQSNVQMYRERDAGKVVIYTTSMGIVRDTYTRCANVKQILKTLLVKFEERDVFMSVDYQLEIKHRMQSKRILVPQLFVDGQYIGSADKVVELNETGELRQMLRPFKSICATVMCQLCGGYRLLPCPACKGSKKSVYRNHFTTEFVALKCMNCNEVGLVKCYNC